jgi:hypothetical protein
MIGLVLPMCRGSRRDERGERQPNRYAMIAANRGSANCWVKKWVRHA